MTIQHSYNLEALIRILHYEANHNPDPQLRAQFQDLLEKALAAKEDYEDLLVEAHNWGVRLPDFEGDQMGRPADDFWDAYEEEDEDSDNLDTNS